MPRPEVILAGLEQIAQRYVLVAIVCRLVVVACLIAVAAGWRPSRRTATGLLAAPLVCVSLLALDMNQPFNAVVFATIVAALIWRSVPLTGPTQLSPARWSIAAGAAMIVFGWAYPHFLADSGPLAPLYAAPTGLLPCPTLALVIGFTLLMGGLGSTAWSAILAVSGLFYGVFGVWVLGVRLDGLLVLGALALGVQALVGRSAAGRCAAPRPGQRWRTIEDGARRGQT